MNKINYFVDIFLFFLFCLVSVSGFILLFLPHGPHSSNMQFISFYKYQWIQLHIWSSIALFFFVGFHLLLHWKWILLTTKNIFFQKK